MVTPALKSGPADFNSACPSSSWQSVNDVKWYTKGACYTFCHKHIVEWWKKSGLLAVSRKVGFGIGGSSMTSGLRRVDASKVSDSRFPTNGITIPVDIYILYVFQVSDSTTSLHKSLNFFSLNHVKSTIFLLQKMESRFSQRFILMPRWLWPLLCFGSLVYAVQSLRR